MDEEEEEEGEGGETEAVAAGCGNWQPLGRFGKRLRE